MRFADAVVSRPLAALACAFFLCAPALADEKCPVSPADMEAHEKACREKSEREVCIRIRDVKNCPIAAVVSTGPNPDKGPWHSKSLPYGAGVIACPHPQTWVHVEPARGFQWQGARLCDLEGMLLRFRPAGSTNNYQPLPAANAARTPRR